MINKQKNLTITNQFLSAIFVIYCVDGTAMNVKLIFVKTILFNIRKKDCVKELYNKKDIVKRNFLVYNADLEYRPLFSISFTILKIVDVTLV
jgi:hypothetical protein